MCSVFLPSLISVDLFFKLINIRQGVCYARPGGEELLSKLLDRKWTMKSPDTIIHQIKLSAAHGKHGGGQWGDISFLNNTCPFLGDDMIMGDEDRSFYVVRDDLLHPLVNGNKARKLDGLLPLLKDHLVTDVVRFHFFLDIRWLMHYTCLKSLIIAGIQAFLRCPHFSMHYCCLKETSLFTALGR